MSCKRRHAPIRHRNCHRSVAHDSFVASPFLMFLTEIILNYSQLNVETKLLEFLEESLMVQEVEGSTFKIIFSFTESFTEIILNAIKSVNHFLLVFC